MNFGSEIMMYCPFCQKQTIKVLEKPGYKGFGKSRGSGVTSSFSTSVQGQYHVLNGCSACGKGVNEVEKGLFG